MKKKLINRKEKVIEDLQKSVQLDNDKFSIVLLSAEWKKFKLWCEQNGYHYKIPGEYGFMNNRNANSAFLVGLGKIKLMEYGGRVDAEFEMVGEVELLPEKEYE